MGKIISVLTATRAEYGLLKPLITKLNDAKELEVRIAVTGMHLSTEFGLTYREIEQDGFQIDRKIEILSSQDSPAAISEAMGRAMIGFGSYFAERRPDLLVVLGDRYETLAVCCAAMNANIPIAHLYGGETTEGAVDESIRHAITKMSYLHFTSTEEYRIRVIQLGESPDRVFTVGALGIENIKNIGLLSREELKRDTGIETQKQYALVTFHPVTLEYESAKEQFSNLLEALDRHPEYGYVFTKANADANGRIINEMIEEYAASRSNVKAFASLGMLRYLSAMKYCTMVIGNSSSGLLEAPSFKVVTVNIGDRQKGRIKCASILDCPPDIEAISAAILKAGGEDMKKIAAGVINPYGDGQTSDKIVAVLLDYLLHSKIDLKKKFYNIDFDV